mgnify:CR=1 FL=1
MKKSFSSIIKIIKNNIIHTKSDKLFIKHNYSLWSESQVKNPKSVILTDFYGLREHFIMSSYFLNIFAKKNSSKIVVFSLKPTFWKRVFVNLYKSINVSEYLILNKHQTNDSNKVANNIFIQLKSKNDLIELEYKSVTIGIDIYETYLRTFNEPTVNIKDSRLLKLIEQTISYVDFFLNYFEKNKVSACVLSHDCYIPYNVVAKIAYNLNIPVYLPNSRGLNLVSRQFDLYDYFKSFREIFQTFSKEKQKIAMNMTKNRLEKRFSGEVGVDMYYSTKSAFHNSNLGYRIVKDNNKTKILILTHDFFDNPHAYNKFLFPDFYEWLKFLIKIARETDYDWYVKSHPDTSDETIKIVNELFQSNPKFTIVPLATSHFQLVNEGIDYALTGHGTVGHEYPLMGVDVINIAYNPHIAYSFNYHMKSLLEYEKILKNFKKFTIKINKDEIYECYYLLYYHTFSDDIIFNSYRNVITKMKENIDDSYVYNLFLDEFNEEKHNKIMKKINTFIDSKKKHFFELTEYIKDGESQ